MKTLKLLKTVSSMKVHSATMKRALKQHPIGSFFSSLPSTPKKQKTVDSDDTPPRTNVSSPVSKHRLNFYSGWLSRYKWLSYEEDEGMFCTLCTKFKQKPKNSDVWTKTGAKSYREDVIRNHERSNVHRIAMDMERDSILTKQSGGIEASMQKVVTVERQAFMSSLRCMYFLMQKEIPHTTNFADLLDLARQIGCSYLDTLHVENKVNYTSFRTMQEMVWCLGETIQEKILQNLRASRFFSILIDETTDISVLKQLIIYVKYLEGSTPTIKFLAMEDLADGKADTITTKIREVFDNLNVEMPGHLAAIGSDGAAVMVGRKTGVATQLKEVSPMILSNHCIAHRLALAVRQAGDVISQIKAFHAHLDSIYRFYENSPVRLAALKEIQMATDNPILKPKQPKTMRWLSHDKACDTLRQILPSVMMSLEREAQERHDSLALGLTKNVQTHNFIYILHIMCDILPQMSILSKCFQEAGMDYTTVQDHIQTTLDFLDSRLSSPGRHYLAAPQVIETLTNEGFNIKMMGITDADAFRKKVHDTFILALINNISNRFPDSGVISAFSCLDPSGLREVSRDNLDFYGEDKIQVLTNHFSDEVDEEATMVEYQSFRMVLHKHRQESFRFILDALINKYQELYPNLAILAEICLVIPASTADCERGFSALKRIKTSLRNRLSQKVLNNLMSVAIQGPSAAEFDFERACSIWSSMRQRKIDLNDCVDGDGDKLSDFDDRNW